MKTLTIFVLVLLSTISAVDGRKSKKNGGRKLSVLTLGGGSGGQQPKITVKIPTDVKEGGKKLVDAGKKVVHKMAKINENKKAIMKKLAGVKTTEDFFRALGVSFRKVKKAKKVPSTNINKDSSSSLLSSAKQTGQQEEEYDFFVMSPASLTTENVSPPADGSVLKSTSDNEVGGSKTELSIEEMACKPRPTVHSVESANRDDFIFPGCFTLWQCGGCCQTKPGFECRPTSVRVDTKQYFVYSFLTGFVGVSHKKELVHHETCECQCPIQADDCLPTQTFSPDICACECQRDQEVCPAGKQWSHAHCGCICRDAPPSCGSRKEWSTETCQCQCKPRECAANEYLDPNLCMCVLLN